MTTYKYEELLDKDNIKKNPIVVTIDDFPDYEIDTNGNVWNRITGKMLNPNNCYGYKKVCLFKDSKPYFKFVHRLVAMTFINNPNDKEQVDHIDNNKINNKLYNLRWVTKQENSFNRPMNVNNNSGVKGVYWDKKIKKWHAEIRANGKRKHIGYYDDLKDAQDARQEEARKLFGRYCHSSEK
jgi:hypothetical protein